MERRLTAILAADVVGYSRLMGLDEAGTLADLNHHRTELFNTSVARHHGRIVKLTGDGLLIEFSSVVNAVACAVDIQRGMRDRNRDVPPGRRIEFRIGVNLGDVIVENDDIFGDGVNLAARLEAFAEPGGISISGSVRDHVGSRLDLVFEDMGERSLKNIDRPVRVYNILLGAAAGADDRAPSSKDRWDSARPRIAVLPFNNMSGDPEQEYFSDGITEDIITDLSKVSGLYVVARNTVFTYKGKPIRVQQAALELDVKFVLEGSVRKAGQRVRVTGQLIDAADGGHIWADRYDRDLIDIFAIQDEITRTIVEQLKVRLLPEEKKAIEKASTANVEAYTYYLKGRELFREWTKSHLLSARRMFAMAATLDPDYGRAYAGIAACDATLFVWHSEKVSPEAIMKTSAKAIALDPGLAEAHASLGLALQHDGRTDEATAAFEQALSVDPNSFEANFFYARLCYLKGDFAASAVYSERAAEIHPDDYMPSYFLASVYRGLGRFAEAERCARKSLQLAEEMLALHPENGGPAHRAALLLAYLGEAGRVRNLIARALVIDPDDLAGRYNIAAALSVIGDHDEALDHLEKFAQHTNPLQLSLISNEPDFDPIRNHPRFRKIFAGLDEKRAVNATSLIPGVSEAGSKG
ncbi:tetratricopeptide repeat protein [Mesorhizobium sp. WSM4904]|uniref:TPR end-of-group domain-containing protein n=1 Tax=Mesorhizobium sp. WSM4904 TaxID=3038545 RepID=UPI00241814A2|nr:tetratricopeptide repeat protein [Mesorhizobium sp. WSM4904]WFP61509.1 tetratricopeptide repeat protein [Mesorhizobium sp. WSM4904]